MKFSLVPRSGLALLLGIALVSTSSLRSQTTPTAVIEGQLTPEQVDQLLGPIALYPDALVALILPAATTPGDIVLAERYLANGGDPDQIDNQQWSDSVKGLARYPVLMKWLDDNLAWAQQLGSAFLNQPDEVMNSVQRLRAIAKANGSLNSTAQQKLVLDGSEIEIVPAQPDVIYVPYYDPSLVYGAPGYYSAYPYVTFGAGLSVGYWLNYDVNWRNRVIWIGDRRHNWHERQGWAHHPGPGPGGGTSNNGWRPWKPPVTRPPFAPHPGGRPRPDYQVPRPRPFPGSPSNPPHDPRPRPVDYPRPDLNARGPIRDHNRPAAPIPTPSNNSAPRPDRRNNHNQPPTSGPLPQPNSHPISVNPMRPNGYGADHPPMPSARPSNNPGVLPNPSGQHLPPPMATRSAPMPGQGRFQGRPSGQPHPAAPPPAPPPPPPQDNPRDQKPDNPR
ncbi:MAG: DUF3300 domain-containing protein [Opitutaceae bacterium]